MYGYVHHSHSQTYLFKRFKLLPGFRPILFLDRGYYGGIFNPLGHQSISTSGHFRSVNFLHAQLAWVILKKQHGDKIRL